MKDLKQKMQDYFSQFDNAEGDIALKKVSDAMNQYIDSLTDPKQKAQAVEAFKYYFAKRVSKIEDTITTLKQTDSSGVIHQL